MPTHNAVNKKKMSTKRKRTLLKNRKAEIKKTRLLPVKKAKEEEEPSPEEKPMEEEPKEIKEEDTEEDMPTPEPEKPKEIEQPPPPSIAEPPKEETPTEPRPDAIREEDWLFLCKKKAEFVAWLRQILPKEKDAFAKSFEASPIPHIVAQFKQRVIPSRALGLLQTVLKLLLNMHGIKMEDFGSEEERKAKFQQLEVWIDMFASYIKMM